MNWDEDTYDHPVGQDIDDDDDVQFHDQDDSPPKTRPTYHSYSPDKNDIVRASIGDDDLKQIGMLSGDDAHFSESAAPSEAHLTAVLGQAVMEGVRSRVWGEREAALQALLDDEQALKRDPVGAVQCGCHILSLLSGETVPQVLFLSLTLLQRIVESAKGLAATRVGPHVKELLPGLVARLGDSRPKVRNEVTEVLLFLCRQPQVQTAMVAATVLVEGPAYNNSLVGRLFLLARMISEFGLSNQSGMAVASVMAVALAALQHRDEKARLAALAVIVQLRKVSEASVLDPYLVTLRPVLLDKLNTMLTAAGATPVEVAAPAPANNTGNGLTGLSGAPSLVGSSKPMVRPGTSGGRAMAAALAAGDLPELPYAEPLPENLINEAKPVIDVFDEDVARCIYGKVWGPREAALRHVDAILRNTPKGNLGFGTKARCAFTIVTHSMSDNVPQVYYAALDLLKTLVTSVDNKVCQGELEQHLERVLGIIIHKLGDSNARTHKASTDAILGLARLTTVSSTFVPSFVMACLSEKATLARLTHVHVELQALLVDELGLGRDTGVSLAEIMAWTLQVLAHASIKVRSAGVDLVVQISRVGSVGTEGITPFVCNLKPALLTKINNKLVSLQLPPVIPAEPSAGARPKTGAPGPRDRFLTRQNDTGAPVAAGPATTSTTTTASEVVDLGYAEPLTDELAIIAQPVTDAFGEDVARAFFGKNWAPREAALRKVEGTLRGGGEGGWSEQQRIRCAYNMLGHSMTDNVAQVYWAGLVLLRTLARECLATIDELECREFLDRLLPFLVTKLGDSNARTQNASRETLLFLVSLKHVGLPVVAPHVLEECQDARKLLQAKLLLLQDFVEQFSFVNSDNKEHLPVVMKFILAGFGSQSGRVRDAAVALFAELYLHVGSDAKPYLENVNPALVKKLKLRVKKRKQEEREKANQGFVEDEEEEDLTASPNSREQTTGQSGREDELPYAEPISDDLKEALQPFSAVFGENILRCLFGRQWAPREAAVRRLERDLATYSVDEAKLFRMGMFLCKHVLQDKVAQVYFSGLDLMKSLLAGYATNNPEVPDVISEVLPLLLSRLGDSNPRLRQGSEDALIFLTRVPEVGAGVVGQAVLDSLSTEPQASGKSVLAWLEMLVQVISEFGCGAGSQSGLATEVVMGAVLATVENRHGKVRDASVRVFAEASRCTPDTVQYIQHLKPALVNRLSQAVIKRTNLTTVEADLKVVGNSGSGFVAPSNAADRLLGPVPTSRPCTAVLSGERSLNVEESDVQALLRQAREQGLLLMGTAMGDDVAAALYNEQWQVRQDAMEKVLQFLCGGGDKSNPTPPSEINVRKTIEALIPLLRCHITAEKLHSVYSVACDLLILSVVASATVVSGVDNMERRLLFGSLMSVLCGRLGDNNARIVSSSEEVMLCLARHPSVGVQFVVHYLLQPAPPQLTGVGLRASLLGRLRLLEDMLPEFTGGRDIEVEAVIAVCILGLQQSAGSVKQAAKRVAMEAARLVGQKRVEQLVCASAPMQLPVIHEFFVDNADETFVVGPMIGPDDIIDPFAASSRVTRGSGSGSSGREKKKSPRSPSFHTISPKTNKLSPRSPGFDYSANAHSPKQPEHPLVHSQSRRAGRRQAVPPSPLEHGIGETNSRLYHGQTPARSSIASAEGLEMSMHSQEEANRDRNLSSWPLPKPDMPVGARGVLSMRRNRGGDGGDSNFTTPHASPGPNTTLGSSSVYANGPVGGGIGLLRSRRRGSGSVADELTPSQLARDVFDTPAAGRDGGHSHNHSASYGRDYSNSVNNSSNRPSPVPVGGTWSPSVLSESAMMGGSVGGGAAGVLKMRRQRPS